MKRNVKGKHTNKNLPIFKNINYFIDVKESKTYYKKFQKKSLRRKLKGIDYTFVPNKDLKIYCKDGWCWKKTRNDLTVKQWLRRYYILEGRYE